MPTISELTSATPTTTDTFPIVQSGSTKKSTLGALFDTLTGFLQSGSGAVARTPQSKMREFISVQDFMTAAEIADANVAAGPTNNMHSAAFTRAFAAAETLKTRNVYVPPVQGAYSVRDVEVPRGCRLWGFARTPYPSVAIPYENTPVSSLLTMGSVIVRATGGTSLFKFFAGCTLDSLVLHGVDRSVDLCQRATGVSILSSMRFLNCGIYGFRNGIGDLTASMSGTRVVGCMIGGNTNGIYQLVDSLVFGNFISFNHEVGVYQPAGGRDTAFSCNKVEWSGQENYLFVDNEHNTIDGDVIDRSGLAGIKVVRCLNIRLNPGVIRRSGRTNLAAVNCAHIRIEGPDCQVSIGPIQTQVGENDVGMIAGDITPSYGVSIDGDATTNVTLVGGDYTDPITAGIVYGGSGSPSYNIIGALGIQDRVTSGFRKTDEDGRTFYARELKTVAAGATSSAIAVSYPSVAINTNRTFKIRIEARQSSGGGAANTLISGEAMIGIVRVAGSASIYFIEAPFQASTTSAGVTTKASTYIGASASETFQLAFANVAADASSFDVTVKNNHGTDTYQVMLTVAQ